MLGIFVVGWFALAQHASFVCANNSVTQTQAVRGPGSVAVLKVSAEDDHSKDSHSCLATYKLLITSASADSPSQVEVLASDSDWDRNISLQLSGYTHDGKRILGMLTEGGPTPMQQIFDYNMDDGTVRLFDVIKLASHAAPAKCLPNTEVVGTVESGAIVARLNTGKNCGNATRWLFNSVYGPIRRAPKHASVLEFYVPTKDIH
jgi:hypothetical protein